MYFRKWLEMAMDLSQFTNPFANNFKDLLAKSKKKVILYHGTSTNHFWSIVKKGFSFDPSRRNWEDTTPGNYFSFDLTRAEMYCNKAINVVGGEPIVFVLETPVSMIDRDEDDAEKYDKDTNFQSVIKAEVPAKFITGVVYPVDKRMEIPIQKFIKLINKGKIPAISSDKEYQKPTRQSHATIEDVEHSILNYLSDLVQYTDFSYLALNPDFLELSQKVVQAIHSGELLLQKILNWNGETWVKWLEKLEGKENKEDYYKEQLQFKVPMINVLNKKYGPDIEGFKKYRLNKI